MSNTALSGLAPYWYTPIEQRDDPGAQQFKLRPLDGMQYLEVMHHGTATEGGRGFVTDFHGKTLLLKYGIVDWKNVEAPNGDPIPCLPRNFGEVSASVLHEIGNDIFSKSSLVEADRKKSSSQSRSSATNPDSTARNVSGDATAIDPTPRPSSNG